MRISFNNTKFDAVVCLNANLPDEKVFKLLSGLPLIAADGAALRLLALGIVPDLVIGDMDSFSVSPQFQSFDKTKIMINPDQETNDYEKILSYCLEKGFKNLLILGFHGGELEHTLNNWSVFKKFALKLNQVIFDEGRYGFALFKSSVIECSQGEMISLIPQPEVRLTTKNLRWELSSENLEMGQREGARNVALKNEIEIKIEMGSLLLFMDARLPVCPDFLV